MNEETPSAGGKMKGKIAFVAGAAIGYVLGAKAGRARYEQIKRGAEYVWSTDAVQRGVGAVRGAAQSRVDQLRSSALRAGRDAFTSLVNKDSESRATSGEAPPRRTSKAASKTASKTTSKGDTE